MSVPLQRLRPGAVEKLTHVELSGRASPGPFEMTPADLETRSSHTEARAVRQFPLSLGDTMLIEGQYEACRSCKGYMNRAARSSGATIID